MNNEITLELLKTCEVIKLEGKGLREELFKNAAEKTDLALADYLTIRDLKALSGCGDDALDALLISMFRALEEGSLCLKLTGEALKKRLDLFLAEGSEKLAAQIMENAEKGRYADLIGRSMEEYKPLIIRRQKDSAYIYFQKYLKQAVYC